MVHYENVVGNLAAAVEADAREEGDTREEDHAWEEEEKGEEELVVMEEERDDLDDLIGMDLDDADDDGHDTDYEDNELF